MIDAIHLTRPYMQISHYWFSLNTLVLLGVQNIVCPSWLDPARPRGLPDTRETLSHQGDALLGLSACSHIYHQIGRAHV